MQPEPGDLVRSGGSREKGDHKLTVAVVAIVASPRLCRVAEPHVCVIAVALHPAETAEGLLGLRHAKPFSEQVHLRLP